MPSWGSAGRRCARRSSGSRSRIARRHPAAPRHVRLRRRGGRHRPHHRGARGARGLRGRARRAADAAAGASAREAMLREVEELGAARGPGRADAGRRAHPPLRVGGVGQPVPRRRRSSATSPSRCASGTSCSTACRASATRSTTRSTCSRRCSTRDGPRAQRIMREHVLAFQREILAAYCALARSDERRRQRRLGREAGRTSASNVGSAGGRRSFRRSAHAGHANVGTRGDGRRAPTLTPAFDPLPTQPVLTFVLAQRR